MLGVLVLRTPLDKVFVTAAELLGQLPLYEGIEGFAPTAWAGGIGGTIANNLLVKPFSWIIRKTN